MRLVLIVLCAFVAHAQAGPRPAIPYNGAERVRPAARVGGVKAIGIEADPATRVVKRSIAQLRYCYERQLQKQPDLIGRATLTITIDKEGMVTDASSTKFEANVDACVAARAKRWRFGKPTQERGVVIVALSFAPSEDRLPSPPAIPRMDPGVAVTYSAPAITGTLDARGALAVVTAGMGAHEDCFAAVDATTPGGRPNTKGTLAIGVDGGGHVTSTTLTDIDGELAACLHRRTQQLVFSPPKDGQAAGIAIQVTFKKKAPKKK